MSSPQNAGDPRDKDQSVIEGLYAAPQELGPTGREYTPRWTKARGSRPFCQSRLRPSEGLHESCRTGMTARYHRQRVGPSRTPTRAHGFKTGWCGQGLERPEDERSRSKNPRAVDESSGLGLRGSECD